MEIKTILHYFLHLIAPALIAFIFFRSDWKRVYLVFLASMFVDLDHLLANPIFDPNRCSINFHPLHHYIAVLIYAIGVIFKKSRVLALALLFHMLTDAIDCYL